MNMLVKARHVPLSSDLEEVSLITVPHTTEVKKITFYEGFFFSLLMQELRLHSYTYVHIITHVIMV